MARYAGARDSGSTTGVATMVLALISAGTVASITLLGVHQLAPAISERLRSGAPVLAPAGVVVSPRAGATAEPGTPRTQSSKPRKTPAPSDVAVEPAGASTPTTQRGVTEVVIQAVDTVVKTSVPAVPVPTAIPTSPAVATPSPSALPRTISRHHDDTSRSTQSRRSHDHSRQRDTSYAGGRSARSHRGSSGCAAHGGRHHRAYPDNAYGDTRGRRAQGHHGSSADRGASGRGSGHGNDGGSSRHGSGDRGQRGGGNGHGSGHALLGYLGR